MCICDVNFEFFFLPTYRFDFNKWGLKWKDMIPPIRFIFSRNHASICCALYAMLRKIFLHNLLKRRWDVYVWTYNLVRYFISLHIWSSQKIVNINIFLYCSGNWRWRRVCCVCEEESRKVRRINKTFKVSIEFYLV